jgi:hypothetical protein
MSKISRTVLVSILVVVIGLAAGCAPKAAENKDVPDSEFITAARSFAEQAAVAGNHHLTGEPVVTIDSKSVQAGQKEVIMLIKAMDVLNSGDVDAQPSPESFSFFKSTAPHSPLLPEKLLKTTSPPGVAR